MVKGLGTIHNQGFVNGAWVNGAGRKTFPVINPATQGVVIEVADLGADETRRAIDAADAAFPTWSSLLPADRAKMLHKWADLIERDADRLALLMTTEQGKPLTESKGEVVSAAATIHWCAEQGRRLYGEFIEGPRPGTKIIISRHPAGVCGAITPWNFPVSMITRKVGPALGAGCTVVLKPAENTPLCALGLAALAQEAGMPGGVLNVIPSADAKSVGKILTEDARVKKISFTGSTEVGKILMGQAAHHVQKVSMELGGNAPFIVLPSADLEKAAAGAIACKFRNAGQTCICANRIYVHEDVYDRFFGIFLKKVKDLKVGDGTQDGVNIGPLINKDAVEKIEKMIAEANKGGAKVQIGGQRHELGGTFYQPTVMTDVSDDMSLSCKEIFGPVAVLYSYKTEEEVIRRANATPFGLAAYIYGTDMGAIWRVSDALAYGMVGINDHTLATDLAPFGGVKESGIGREGGEYGLLEYTDLKYRLIG
jgi:succinate-semialdehyde dehydrogenase / glutarate-semialdehyde dehydrogenase